MTRLAPLAPAALVLALALAGCGGEERAATPAEPEAADAFFKRLLGHELSGRFGRSWQMLHPGHQELVTRERYVACSADDFGATELTSARTVSMRDEAIDVRAVPEKTSKAVTLRLTLRSNGEEDVSTHTFHAVRVDDRWTWYLGDGAIDAYRGGSCP